MTRYLLPVLLLLACGGDSDPAGPEPDTLRAEAGWVFFVDCPAGRTTVFSVLEAVGSNLNGVQLDQTDALGAIHQSPATSRVSYSGDVVTYEEDETLEDRVEAYPIIARTAVMEWDGERYAADATIFCGWPSNTNWPDGAPIMALGP